MNSAAFSETEFLGLRHDGRSHPDTNLLSSFKIENNANSSSIYPDVKSILAQQWCEEGPEFVVGQGDRSEGNALIESERVTDGKKALKHFQK